MPGESWWPNPYFYEVALRKSADAYRVVREVRHRANRDRFENAPACAKALAGSVRDLVAWRCTRLAGHNCKDSYMACLDHAFDGCLSLDKDLKSQLLNSFHHIVGGADEAFKSQSSQRGRRRPPRQSRGGSARADVDEPEAHGGGQARPAPQPGSCLPAMPAQQTASAMSYPSRADSICPADTTWPFAVFSVLEGLHGCGSHAIPSIPSQYPRGAAEQVVPIVPPGVGRRVLAVNDPAYGVATLQYAAAHSHERQEEVAPMQPHQGATTCQNCGVHDPCGWASTWRRFYCARSDRGGPRHPACSGTEKCSLNVPRDSFVWRYRLQSG